ncbi:MAG: hypothetical protein HND46_01855 [Chloroflexi bacterium]|nr:hypothetical protein [Chloroflexota bacterium]NOG62138.1 hypothetical protein [Chloroflexota bacterium]
MPPRKRAPSPLQDLLTNEAQDAGLLAALLVSPKDELVASYVAAGLDKATAETPLLTTQRIFGNAESRAQLAQLQESVFYDLDGRRLICRPLMLPTLDDTAPHLLVVLTTAEQTYRRALNKLIRAIENATGGF